MQLIDVAISDWSTPMSRSRAIELAALWVCSVVRTRWPVIAAWIAIRAVSSSRTSPIRTTSGSERSIVRRPLANVSPARTLTSTCVIPGIWFSTGSSIVASERSSSFRNSSAA